MHLTEVESEIKHHLFKTDQKFLMESGKSFPGYHLYYTTIGKLNNAGDNVIWIFHALTANSNPAEWWPGMIGEGKLFDPAKHFIVCVNMPGSCYGSSGPLDINPQTGEPWYHDFPFFTPRDMARAYGPLKDALGIKQIRLAIGGSMGGQQLLEWAVEEPKLFKFIVPIATNAFHSPWGKAFNASQRLCIETDSTWSEKNPTAGITGMKTARALALISYRHYDAYAETQKDEIEILENFRSESYQRYQGEKLAKRFNAFSYYFLSKGMDSHHLGRGRGSAEAALKKIEARALIIGIESDVLFPVIEQKFLADNIPDSKMVVINSTFGHDGFLLEYEKISSAILQYTCAL